MTAEQLLGLACAHVPPLVAAELRLGTPATVVVSPLAVDVIVGDYAWCIWRRTTANSLTGVSWAAAALGWRCVFAGRAGEPTYTFVDDPDTGIYLGGTDTITFSVGGQQAFALPPGSDKDDFLVIDATGQRRCPSR